jgi:hypothetical protein
MKFYTNIFEIIIAIFTFLSIIILGSYFYELINPVPTENNPFEVYNNNQGIIVISLFNFILRIIFITCFLLLAFEKIKPKRNILIVYIFSALTIGFLQWYELYYGSTFYYGEVRDKQGLTFPMLSSLMVTLIIWKINYSRTEKSNLALKLLLTILINSGLYFLWTEVYEVWNLWQS